MTHVNYLPDMVEDMLLDAGYGKDPELRAALLALGSLASLPAPAPSGHLAVLLAEATTSTESETDELAGRRRLRTHRPTVVGLALIAGMGLGVGGVAASSAVPGQSGSLSIQHMLEDWTPAWSLPAPDAPGSMALPDGRDGPSTGAMLQGEPEPGATEESVTRSGIPAATPAAADPSVPPRNPDVPAPDTFGQGTQGNGDAERSGGQNSANHLGQGRAAAAQEENGVAAGVVPEPAVGQGTAGAKSEANHVAGASPGVRADSVPEVLRQGVDTAGAAVQAVPGAKWLQKFSR
ncbi:hypothetical protein [Arthrobacter sp. D3-16]